MYFFKLFAVIGWTVRTWWPRDTGVGQNRDGNICWFEPKFLKLIFCCWKCSWEEFSVFIKTKHWLLHKIINVLLKQFRFLKFKHELIKDILFGHHTQSYSHYNEVSNNIAITWIEVNENLCHKLVAIHHHVITMSMYASWE